MERLLKLRSTSRGWLTRASRALEEATLKQEVTVVEVKHAIDEFNNRLHSLDDIQSQIEVDTDESSLEEIIEEAFIYRQRQLEVKIKAEILLQKLENSKEDTKSDSLATHRDSKTRLNFLSNARLPKLELPKFGGNYLEFNSFFDKFVAIVDKSELPAVTKFTYLQSLLTGEALASIKGLSVTDESYPAAKDILLQRYGRRERIIFAHIQKLLSLQGDFRKPNSLWHLYDSLQSHVRSLETLGVSGDTYGVILTPLVLSRIPQEIRLEWAREGEGRESDLNFLLDFLYKEIKRRERSQTFQKSESQTSGKKVFEQPQPSVAAFHTNSSGAGRKHCSFSNKAGHKSEDCFSLKKMSSEDVRNKIKSMNLCFVCLGHHFAKNCRLKHLRCKHCNGRHNSLMCQKTEGIRSDHSDVIKEIRSASPPPSNNITYAHIESKNKNTLMQVVKTVVRAPNGQAVEANVLFDGGSDRSFLTRNLAQKLKLKRSGEDTFSFSGFGNSGSGPRIKRKLYDLELGGIDVELAEINVICADMYRAPVPKSVLNKFSIDFTEDLEVGRSIPVDILIGLDYYWKLVGHDVVQVDSLVAQKTLCGWMLSGVYSGESKSKGLQLLCVESIPDNVIRSLWELDSIGIVDNAAPVVDEVQAGFETTISFEKGRYSVHLPWKVEQKGKLMNNKAIAERRLMSLSRRLAGKPELKEAYNQNLAEMEGSGIIKQVSSEDGIEGPVFYLPHRPVVREDSRTTKVRPVFDASAKGYNGVSLNDCLEAGPNLLPNLLEVLIRFRRWKIAVTADVAKAFLQIRVHKTDQNVLRFLWETDGRIKEMVFDRVPFGTKASPFLLNATIKHHLGKYPGSKAISELHSNLYVDDFLSGADSEVEALQLIADAKKIMSEAGMDLTKWASNNQVVADTVLKEFDPRFAIEDSTKVLGLKWLPAEDCFSFSGLAVPEGLVLTKRTVLSFIARLFDPLGFLAPFVITAKLLFQELWELGIDWDQELPEPHRGQFERWLKELDRLQEWKIPRCFVSSAWSDADEVQLHIFCDASEKAYGCCAYLRVQEGSDVRVSLVMTKARVAPLKSITLPRLELLGALLAARVVQFLLSALHLPPDTVYRCYTDSMVALGWIRGNSHRWKTFVANRVQEIQNLTNPTCWSHVTGSENPADMLTRGIEAKTLTRSPLWLHGPDWLIANSPPASNEVIDYEREELLNRELKATQCGVTTQNANTEPLFQLEKWSSLEKATRIVGWTLRFVTNCLKNRMEKSHQLTCDELKKANRQLIHLTQSEHFHEEIACLKVAKAIPKSSCLYKLSPFVGEDGLVRARCRLNYSDLSYDEKFPIVLPKCHLSLLIVRDIHAKLKHAGVNQMITAVRCQYWIIGLRSLARKVKSECLSCKYLDAKACQEPVAPLMEARLKRAPPFSTVGLDYAGPIYCKDFPTDKFYVLLFT